VKMNRLNPDLLHATGKGFLGFETGHFLSPLKQGTGTANGILSIRWLKGSCGRSKRAKC
jgi:hypothetical protein